MLSVAYKAGAPWNETHWNNSTFDKLLSDAKSELDPAKRKTYLWECQRMLSDEGGALVPAFQDYLSASTDKVGGITVHKGFDMDNGRVMEKAFIKG
jgi:peptide/nickel transport system substrate-binding protein